jgi:hypothetical protein
MTEDIPALRSLEQFLFEVPPYSDCSLRGDIKAENFYNFSGLTVRVDGHCPYCQRASTFTVKHQFVPAGDYRRDISKRIANDSMSIECVRNPAHNISYYFRIKSLIVQKIGQYPSLADVANDEVLAYRKGMDKSDSAEFHKAIGLAAHGVGVGSFVYLRRVFERLIHKRFEEFKLVEGWEDRSFYPVRMEDKVDLLKDHLPEFLVENRKIYSILSVGIHELDEKKCLQWFGIMKQSIIIILVDDKKKKEDLERKAAFSTAIASFTSTE